MNDVDKPLSKAFDDFADQSSHSARASVERDIELISELPTQSDNAFGRIGGEEILKLTRKDDARLHTPDHRLGASHRRLSIPTGSRPATIPFLDQGTSVYITDEERTAARKEERSLLRDNGIIPPKHPRRGSEAWRKSFDSGQHSISALQNKQRNSLDDEESVTEWNGRNSMDQDVSETAYLVGDPDLPYGGLDSPENIDKKWDEAVTAGKIQTTWQREAKVVARYSRSLILTTLLQFSLPIASVFTIGHIGKIELGAVSLGSMTANITGYAVYQGLAASLDTLCAQAYGSGHKQLVGLQMQRMIYLLWLVTIPIAIVWLNAPRVLAAIVPEKETARLAGLYLRIVVFGAPGYAAFEAGKRFVQAQGLFAPTLYVLLIVAPLNVFLHWLFVWHLRWGFVGAPIAVTITENLLPLFLFLYVFFIDGRQCWGGFSRKALQNWGTMVQLALPGLFMIVAEYLAFELITLSASRISSTHLAATTIIGTVISVLFCLTFPISIAASTRIANLIGATLAPAAKTTAKMSMIAAGIVGTFNCIIVASLKGQIPWLFTNDAEVADLVTKVLPICAAFQIFDALSASCNGVLRGIGQQRFGGWVCLVCYYMVAMPISLGTCFGLHWDLYGLWAGPAVALFLVSTIEGWFILRTNWMTAVEDAKRRNEAG